MKTPEQAITAENTVITRLRVTEEFGVKFNIPCGFRERVNAAIPRIIGKRFRSFSAALLVERNSVKPAMQNAIKGKKPRIRTSSFIFLPR